MRKWLGGPIPGGISNNEDRGGPWGGSGGGSSGGGGGGSGGGPRNPWSQPPRRKPPGGVGNVTSLDDFLQKSRRRFNGGGGFPGGQSPKVWLWGALGFLALWLLFTSFHRIGSQERGVVTLLGSYGQTLRPGVGVTLPAPLSRVQKVDVEEIRTLDVASSEAENLMLTGDQNVIDIAYQVRWNIADPERYLFQIADPEGTIREVAESAMRAVVGTVTLNEAIGEGRAEIEQRVATAMQVVLDDYRSGIRVQGVAIRQADPPRAVNDAFKEVSAAQQQAQSYINDARAYALQLTAKAQGEAAAFDKVYAEYKLAPEVTRRRMYYETMEDVLAKVDKTIVETPGGVTPYLPLPEVQRNRGAAAATPAPSAGATAATGAAR